MFWDPNKHKRNKGGHPYYQDPTYRLGINPEVPPRPVVHMLRPMMAMVRFPVERFLKNEYNAREPQDQVIYHPKWIDWKVPKPPRIIEICPGSFVYIPPNKPKKMRLGKDIPEDEEWIIPHKNNEGYDPNTCVDEQEQINKNSKSMVFKTLPKAAMLPYVPPEMLPKHHREAPLSHNYHSSDNSALSTTTQLQSQSRKSPSYTENQGRSASFNQNSSTFKIPRKTSTSKSSDKSAKLPITPPPPVGNNTKSDRATMKEEKFDIKEAAKAKDNNAPTNKSTSKKNKGDQGSKSSSNSIKNNKKH